MRYIGAALACCGALLSPAVADDALAGRSFIAGQHGQPICAERDELQEYMMAMINQDAQWAKQLKSCGMLKSGIKIVVIEDYPSDSDLGHVVKIRAINERGSAVGYTLSLGLGEK